MLNDNTSENGGLQPVPRVDPLAPATTLRRGALVIPRVFPFDQRRASERADARQVAHQSRLGAGSSGGPGQPIGDGPEGRGDGRQREGSQDPAPTGRLEFQPRQ